MAMAGGAGLLRHDRSAVEPGHVRRADGCRTAGAVRRRADEDGAELAFEALVERHGPMVFRVCRGVLRDEHAAEDAFQATFLVLARKARVALGEGLARRAGCTAWRIASRRGRRSDAARRRRHEQRLAEARGPAWEVMPDRPRSDAWAILSEEIARLPETYRAPVVLCYLEAMSYQAAAASLGVTEDAVRGRLARARERLRTRAWPAEGSRSPPSSRPRGRRSRRWRSGPVWCKRRPAPRSAFRRAGRRPPAPISRSVISLTERTCRTMMLTRLKACAAALALGVIAAGAIVSAQPPGDGRGEHAPPAPATPRPAQAVPARGVT